MFSQNLVFITPRLLRYARSLARDSDAAEDLVQDTLLKAWRYRDRFEQGTNLAAWTSIILKRTFLSQCRRARFQSDYDERTSEIRTATPEQQTAAIEMKDVHVAIGKLPIDQRVALELVTIEGLSYDLAALRIGISPGTLKSRVSRARTALQILLDRSSNPKIEAPAPVALPVAISQTYALAKARGGTLWIG